MRLFGLVALVLGTGLGAAALGGGAPREGAAEPRGGAGGGTAVPGVSARAFEERLAAGGWRLTYRQQADGRRGAARWPGRGLAVEVAERGERAPGLLTGVTCRAVGSDAAGQRDFLDACVPSDVLDPVHHWMAGHWTAAHASAQLTLGDRVFRLDCGPGTDERALSVDARWG